MNQYDIKNLGTFDDLINDKDYDNYMEYGPMIKSIWDDKPTTIFDKIKRKFDRKRLVIVSGYGPFVDKFALKDNLTLKQKRFVDSTIDNYQSLNELSYNLEESNRIDKDNYKYPVIRLGGSCELYDVISDELTGLHAKFAKDKKGRIITYNDNVLQFIINAIAYCWIVRYSNAWKPGRALDFSLQMFDVAINYNSILNSNIELYNEYDYAKYLPILDSMIWISDRKSDDSEIDIEYSQKVETDIFNYYGEKLEMVPKKDFIDKPYSSIDNAKQILINDLFLVMDQFEELNKELLISVGAFNNKGEYIN